MKDLFACALIFLCDSTSSRGGSIKNTNGSGVCQTGLRNEHTKHIRRLLIDIFVVEFKEIRRDARERGSLELNPFDASQGKTRRKNHIASSDILVEAGEIRRG